MIRDLCLVVSQLFVLWLINQAGYFIVNSSGLPLPGNVMAMIILVVLLGARILPIAAIEKAAHLLIKHLAFFFIPITVGLIKFGDLFVQHGIPLVIGLTVSAMIGIYVTGFVSQFLAEKKEGETHVHSNHSS